MAFQEAIAVVRQFVQRPTRTLQGVSAHRAGGQKRIRLAGRSFIDRRAIPFAAGIVLTLLCNAALAQTFDCQIVGAGYGDLITIGNTLGYDCFNGGIPAPECTTAPLPKRVFGADIYWDLANRVKTPSMAKSRAVLTLPRDAQVSYAGLLWASRTDNSNCDANMMPNLTNTAGSITLNSEGWIGVNQDDRTRMQNFAYQCYATIAKSMIRSDTYTVAQIPFIRPVDFPTMDLAVNYIGWSMFVFYEHNSPSKSENFRIFTVCSEKIRHQPVQTRPLTGGQELVVGFPGPLAVPPSATGTLSVVAYETQRQDVGSANLNLTTQKSKIDYIDFLREDRMYWPDSAKMNKQSGFDPGDSPLIDGSIGAEKLGGLDINTIKLTNINLPAGSTGLDVHFPADLQTNPSIGVVAAAVPTVAPLEDSTGKLTAIDTGTEAGSCSRVKVSLTAKNSTPLEISAINVSIVVPSGYTFETNSGLLKNSTGSMTKPISPTGPTMNGDGTMTFGFALDDLAKNSEEILEFVLQGSAGAAIGKLDASVQYSLTQFPGNKSVQISLPMQSVVTICNPDGQDGQIDLGMSQGPWLVGGGCLLPGGGTRQIAQTSHVVALGLPIGVLLLLRRRRRLRALIDVHE